MLPVLTVSMAVFAVYLLFAGDHAWLVGAIATVVTLSVGMMVAVYVVNRRRSLARLESMGKPKGTLTASEDRLRIESGAGAVELPWASIKKIYRDDEFWLVYLDSDAFCTIPTIGIKEEEIQALWAKFKDSGTKVV